MSSIVQGGNGGPGGRHISQDHRAENIGRGFEGHPQVLSQRRGRSPDAERDMVLPGYLLGVAPCGRRTGASLSRQQPGEDGVLTIILCLVWRGYDSIGVTGKPRPT